MFVGDGNGVEKVQEVERDDGREDVGKGVSCSFGVEVFNSACAALLVVSNSLVKAKYSFRGDNLQLLHLHNLPTHAFETALVFLRCVVAANHHGHRQLSPARATWKCPIPLDWFLNPSLSSRALALTVAVVICSNDAAQKNESCLERVGRKVVQVEKLLAVEVERERDRPDDV